MKDGDADSWHGSETAVTDPALFRVLLDVVPAFVIRLDGENRVVYINRLQAGFDRETVIGRLSSDFLCPESREHYNRAIAEARATGRVQRQLVRGVGADGKPAVYDSLFARIDQPPGCRDVCIITLDVTEHVARAETLRENEAKLRVIVEAARIGLWSWDTQSNRVEWNQRMHEITGLSEPVSGSSYLAKLVHPKDRARVSADIHRLLAGLPPELPTHRIIKPDGSVRWIKPLGAPLRDEPGAPTLFSGCLLDVTADKQLEARLSEAQKTEAIGKLMAGMAHNFNNLLGVIVPAVEASISHADEHGKSLLREAAQAARRATTLVSDLLTFAGQRGRGQRVISDMAEMVNRVVSSCRKSFDGQLALKVHTSSLTRPVSCSPAAIEGVILHLILNARDAVVEACSAHPKVTVTLDEAVVLPPGASEPGAHVRLCVIDNGIGMTESVKQRLFEPFFTTKPVDKGTGLGLATSLLVVREHGGFIRFHSQQGAGTTFELYLPCVESQSAGANPPRGESEASLGGSTILLVDDERALRNMMIKAFSRDGAEIVGVGDIAEALKTLAAGLKPDLVLLDRSILEGSVSHAIAEMRRHTGKAPIVFFSGQEVSDSELCLVNGQLQKPVDIQTIRNFIVQHIAVRRAGAE